MGKPRARLFVPTKGVGRCTNLSQIKKTADPSGKSGFEATSAATSALSSFDQRAQSLLRLQNRVRSPTLLDPGLDGSDQVELRLADAAGHQLGIAGAEHGDRLEGDDHPGHRAQQPQQGRDGGDQLDDRLGPLQPRLLCQQR